MSSPSLASDFYWLDLLDQVPTSYIDLRQCGWDRIMVAWSSAHQIPQDDDQIKRVVAMHERRLADERRLGPVLDRVVRASAWTDPTIGVQRLKQECEREGLTVPPEALGRVVSQYLERTHAVALWPRPTTLRQLRLRRRAWRWGTKVHPVVSIARAVAFLAFMLLLLLAVFVQMNASLRGHPVAWEHAAHLLLIGMGVALKMAVGLYLGSKVLELVTGSSSNSCPDDDADAWQLRQPLVEWLANPASRAALRYIRLGAVPLLQRDVKNLDKCLQRRT